VDKKALIITDGTESISNIANMINEALSGFDAQVCSGEAFEGTSLLAADVFFIGCEKSSPESFSYLEDMLAHINLASRKCGVFTTEEKSLSYLCGIVESCEARLGAPLHAASKEIDKAALKKWAQKVTE